MCNQHLGNFSDCYYFFSNSLKATLLSYFEVDTYAAFSIRAKYYRDCCVYVLLSQQFNHSHKHFTHSLNPIAPLKFYGPTRGASIIHHFEIFHKIGSRSVTVYLTFDKEPLKPSCFNRFNVRQSELDRTFTVFARKIAVIK